MFYEKNRKALLLSSFHLRLLDKLETVAPAPDVELFETEAGDYSVVYKGQVLHSIKGAAAEAEALVEKHIRVGSKFHHAILGIGLGYLLQAVYEKDEDGLSWVYESDLPFLRFVLENVDLSEYFASGRVLLASDPINMRELVSSYYTYGDTINIIYTEGYAALWGAELLRVARDEIAGTVNAKRNSLTTIISYQREWNRQFCANMCHIPLMEPFTLLDGYFKDKPAFVVSAGPSLEKAMADIKALEDKAVIISVGTALRPLVNAGIKPDFAIFLDYGGLHKQVAGIEHLLMETSLILSPFVEPVCYELPVKRRFQAMLKNYIDYSLWVEEQIGKLGPMMSSGGTVSMLAFQAAIAMGCKPIVMLGQDLAISGTQLYAGGIGGQLDAEGRLVIEESEDVIAKRLVLENVKGQNGEILKSPPDYAQYIGDFTEFMRQKRQETPGFGAYNASVGGAWIEGFEHVSLGELRQQLPFETIDKTLPLTQDGSENYTFEQKRQNCAKSLSLLVSVVKDSLRLSKEAREHLVFLKQGIDKVNGVDHERRYLNAHKQFLMRIHVHKVLLYFLQKETWMLRRLGDTQSKEYKDIVANYVEEDAYHESAQETLEYALSAMESSLESLKAQAPAAQAVK